MRRLLLLISLTLASTIGWAGTCGNSYLYSKRIVFDHLQVPNTDQTDFPAPLCFNGSCKTYFYLPDLKTAANSGKVQNTVSGALAGTVPADAILCDARSAGNQLKHVWKSYSATTGVGELRVKVPTLSHTTDTSIWLFYDNAAVNTTQEDAAGTFSNGYTGVWLLGDGTSLSAVDATGNQNGTISTPSATSGANDGAASFNGTSDKITLGTTSYVATNAAFSVSFWANITNFSSSSYPHIMTLKSSNVSDPFEILFSSDNASPGYLGVGFGSSTSYTRQHDGSTAASLTAADTFVTVTYNGSGGGTAANYHLVVNGVDKTLIASDAFGASTNTSVIGTAGSGANFWKGKISDLRVAGLRSVDWAQAEYNSERAPNGFAVMVDSTTPSGLTSGAYCIEVPLNHLLVGSSDVTNMQVPIVGYYPWMATIANGGLSANANGYDITWYSNSICTSALSFQRVYRDATTGNSKFVVLVPTVSHTADTSIYVQIGNPGITTDQQNVSAVWGSNGYVGVFHGGTLSGVDCNDSGSAAWNLTVGGSMLPTLSPQGVAMYFGSGGVDANTCGITPTGTDTIGAHGYPTGSATWSYLGWVRINFASIAACINDCGIPGGWGKTNVDGAAAWLWENRPAAPDSLFGFGEGEFSTADAGTGAAVSVGSSPNFPIGGNYGWTFVGINCTGTTIAGCSTYINGAVVTTPFVNSGGSTRAINNNDGNSGAAAEVRLGRFPAHGGGWFPGSAASVRFSTNNLTANQMLAYYNAELAPWTFYSFGTATPVTTSSPRHRVTNQ